ncbi:MAG TPA: hypothetical protein VK963_00725, partial [Candidatus Saccharimonadales bacterium]|nr:hypothetical protein [Candidatus Saccharimonadales bacterium]
FIIPGFIFMAWFMSAPYLAISENLSVTASMKRSRQLAKGRVIDMLGLQGMGSLFGFLGIIPILGTVAGLVLQVVTMPSLAIRTLQLQAVENKPTRTHWINYPIVFLLPILFALAVLAGALSE